MRERPAGRQPVSAAFVASTTSGARSEPRGVSIAFGVPARTRSAGVRSWSVTPAASAARRSARTSSPGCTVAPSGKKTPPRNAGEETRRPSSSGESATA